MIEKHGQISSIKMFDQTDGVDTLIKNSGNDIIKTKGDLTLVDSLNQRDSTEII